MEAVLKPLAAFRPKTSNLYIALLSDFLAAPHLLQAPVFNFIGKTDTAFHPRHLRRQALALA